MIIVNNLKTLIDFMERHNRVFRFRDGFCIFLRLSEERLNEIRENKNALINPSILRNYLLENGNNIHIIGLFTKGRLKVLQGLKKLIENESPETVSWYNRTMERFIFRRVKLCHLS